LAQIVWSVTRLAGRGTAQEHVSRAVPSQGQAATVRHQPAHIRSKRLGRQRSTFTASRIRSRFHAEFATAVDSSITWSDYSAGPAHRTVCEWTTTDEPIEVASESPKANSIDNLLAKPVVLSYSLLSDPGSQRVPRQAIKWAAWS
jgi:hypothetical protein